MRFIAPIAIGLLGTVVLVLLGNWQIERLAWKEALLADIEARLLADPAPLPAVPDPDKDNFLAVTVEGQLGPRELQVLVSTKGQGAGYRLIRALEMADGRRVLVDLGYVRAAQRRQERPAGEATIVGNLRWPDDRNSSTPENDVARNDWFARDLNQMADELETEATLVVARTVRPDKQTQPLPTGSAGIPNDHLGYAMTWYGLALVWAGMTLFWIWRMASRKTS